MGKGPGGRDSTLNARPVPYEDARIFILGGGNNDLSSTTSGTTGTTGARAEVATDVLTKAGFKVIGTQTDKNTLRILVLP